MRVEPVFETWALGCIEWLLSHEHLASYFLDEATPVLGDEQDLPTHAPTGTPAQAIELLDAIAVHAGREGVEHQIVEVPPNDAALEPLEPGEPVGVPLTAAALGDRWSTIALLARGVVTPIVIDVADRGPGGAQARGAVLDVATILAGFGVPIVRAAERGAVLHVRGETRGSAEGHRIRDLDGLEAAHVHAAFELLHDLDGADTDRALGAASREWMRHARASIAESRADLERIRARARGLLRSYRDR